MARPTFQRFIVPVLILGLLTSTLATAPLLAAEVGERASSTPLSESLTGPAKEHYENARLLFDNGDYAGALLKFRQAYESSRDARLLWNIAACEKKQRHYAKMSLLIEQYLREGGPLISEIERSNAESVLDTLQPFVGQIELRVNEPGAAVTIDDEAVGATPLLPLRVDMGRHKIRVSKPGFDDWSVLQDVTGGTSLALNAELKVTRHTGVLRVIVDGGHDVFIDGARVGVGNWSGELPSGTHRLNVRGKGMLPYDTDVVVADKQTDTLRVSLRPEIAPRSDNGTSSAWIWIAGGTLLTAGLLTGGYLLYHSGEMERPSPQRGTMPPGYFELP